MKICKVELKNIRSLTGENTIDFEDKRIQNSGLFLICGEIGVGKTTIFDAITVALYASAPSGESTNEIVSYGKKDAYIQVELEVGDARYKSKWSCYSSKKNIARQTIKREFAILEDGIWKPLTDGTVNSHKTTVKERIGLSFEEFTKSILLAQGQFAKFLHAKSSERLQLLETIAGTTIFKKISIKSYELYKNAVNTVQHKLEEIAAIEILDKDSLAAKKLELSAAKASIDKNRKELVVVEKKETWVETSTKLKAQIAEKDKEILALEPSVHEAIKEFEKVEKHRKIIPFIPTLDAVEELIKKKKASSKDIQLKEKEREALKLEIDRLKATKAETELALEDKKKEEAGFKKLLKEVGDLDQEIAYLSKGITAEKLEKKGIQKKILELNTALNGNTEKKLKLENESNQNQVIINNLTDKKLLFETLDSLLEKASSYEQIEDTIKAKTSEKSNLKSTISGFQTQVDADLEIVDDHKSTRKAIGIEDIYTTKRALEELDKQYKACATKVAEQSTFKTQLERYLQLKDALEAGKSTLKAINEEVKTKQETLLNLAQELKPLLTTQKHLETIQAHENTIKELKDKLEAGNPCLICGATDHLDSSYHAPETSHADELEAVIKKINTHKADQKKLENEVATQQGILQTTKDQLVSDETAFADYDEAFSTYDDIAAFDKSFSALKTELKSIDDQQKELKGKQAKWEKVTGKIDAIQASIDKANQKIKVEETKLGHIQNILDEANQTRSMLLAKFQESFPNVETIAQVNTELQQLKSDKASYIGALNAIEKSAPEVQNLNNKIIGFQTQLDTQDEQLKKLDSKISIETKKIKEKQLSRTALFGEKSVEGELQAFEDEVEKYNTAIASQAENLQIKEQKQTALTTTIALNKKRLKGITEEIDTKKELLKKIKSLPFEVTPHTIRSFVLDDKEVVQIEQTRSSKESELAKLKSEKSVYEKNMNTLEENKLTGTFDNLPALREQLKSQHDALDTLRINLELKLKRNEDNLLAKATKEKAIEADKKKLERWSNLKDLIGSADGAKFQKFAQNLTMQKICIYANNYLSTIAPRYEILTQEDKNQIQNFQIMDTYQANNIRSIKTLSGGETFLVSLALALGLSDLAGTKAKIQSLFIDEGFGTLDNQTLDTVIETLENLQNDGKTIGIISHVKELRDRIGTQIQVSRKGRGTSRIDLVDSTVN